MTMSIIDKTVSHGAHYTSDSCRIVEIEDNFAGRTRPQANSHVGKIFTKLDGDVTKGQEGIKP